MKHVNLSVKITVYAKKVIFGILTHAFVKIVTIQSRIIRESVIVYDAIINVTDSISTNVTNTIWTNDVSAMPITSDDKK